MALANTEQLYFKRTQMEDFKNKVVVVTGGATGIGFSFAKNLGLAGAKIAICGIRQDRIEEAVAKLKELKIKAVGKMADVSKRAEVEALADFAWTTYGRVDVIINNAGIGGPMKSIIDTIKDEVLQLLDVNLFGVWNGVSVFGKRFIEQGTPAAIYNVGSENSFFNALTLGGTYVISKHSVLALTDTLRKEVPPFIRVGLICPGLTNSEIGKRGIRIGMETDKFTNIIIEQMKAGEFFLVSHSCNQPRINERYVEIRKAYETYAPRYEGDMEQYDVQTLIANKAKW